MMETLRSLNRTLMKHVYFCVESVVKFTSCHKVDCVGGKIPHLSKPRYNRDIQMETWCHVYMIEEYNKEGEDAITEYYCRCKNGVCTVDYTHIMPLIW